jgi:ankyrin repeat protein
VTYHLAERHGISIIQSYSPLLSASSCGYADIVQLLIEMGADANFTGRYGQSPLRDASRKDTSRLKLLSEYGAVPNQGSALIFACRIRSEQTVRNLLDARTDVDYTSNEGDGIALTAAGMAPEDSHAWGSHNSNIIGRWCRSNHLHEGYSFLEGALYQDDTEVIRVL